jgi:hypothetical protein
MPDDPQPEVPEELTPDEREKVRAFLSRVDQAIARGLIKVGPSESAPSAPPAPSEAPEEVTPEVREKALHFVNRVNQAIALGHLDIEPIEYPPKSAKPTHPADPDSKSE